MKRALASRRTPLALLDTTIAPPSNVVLDKVYSDPAGVVLVSHRKAFKDPEAIQALVVYSVETSYSVASDNKINGISAERK